MILCIHAQAWVCFTWNLAQCLLLFHPHQRLVYLGHGWIHKNSTNHKLTICLSDSKQGREKNALFFNSQTMSVNSWIVSISSKIVELWLWILEAQCAGELVSWMPAVLCHQESTQSTSKATLSGTLLLSFNIILCSCALALTFYNKPWKCARTLTVCSCCGLTRIYAYVRHVLWRNMDTDHITFHLLPDSSTS